MGSEEPRPDSGVGNFQQQAVVLAMCRDGNIDRFPARFHSVAQGIFQQRLQDELRHERVVERRVDA